MSYKNLKSFEERQSEAQILRQSHPQKVPVILSCPKSSKIDLPEIKKFLVNESLLFINFIQLVRKTAKLQSHEALFVFLQRPESDVVLLESSLSFHEIYNYYCETDGFIYLSCCKESAFGNGENSTNFFNL